MTSYAENKLRELSQTLKDASELLPPELAAEMSTLGLTIARFNRAWSQSQSGYHANVYYKDFQKPPSSALFRAGYGLQPGRVGNASIGDWVEYPSSEVTSRILVDSNDPNLTEIARLSAIALLIYRKSKSDLDSIIAQLLKMPADEFVNDVRDQSKSEKFKVTSEASALKAQFRSSTSILYDTRAANEGKKYAPHQILNARLLVARSSFARCNELAELCTNLADHLKNVEAMQVPTSNPPQGTKIFIGHGHSDEWRKLKEYLTEGLGLQCEEYSRVANAGKTITVRLTSMLEAAQFAFIVMTAEDEVAEGEVRARENVVHEAGLFQGRLGFEKAILVSEKTCHIFSNIHGLERINFSTGNIKEAFSDVHGVLVREGVVSKP